MTDEKHQDSDDERRLRDLEDRRKLHAEVNQLLNHRFLLTTLAITVFGVFSSWMIPRNPSHRDQAALSKLLFAGAVFLHLFLLLLFLWNRFLANLQSNVSIYLVLTKASKWEADWKKVQSMKGIRSTAQIQTTVFLALGIFTLLWPFVISMACDLPLKCGWVLFEVIVAVIYPILVWGFGIKQWKRDEDQIEAQWRKVLESSAPDKPSV